jgi:conserved hypothetical protein, YceG family
MKIIKKLIRFGVLVLLGLAAWMAWFAFRPLDLPVTPYQLTLEPGTSLKGLAMQLENDGVLEGETRFRILGRVMGYAGRLQAGRYTLEEPLSPMELLGKIVRGEVTKAAILLVEGWNIREVRQELARNPHLEHQLVDMTDADMLGAIGAEEKHPEGLFFPYTYFFNPDSPDIDVLRRAYKLQQEKLLAAWETRAPDLPYETPYEALIMASIIEKETGAPEERPQIAAVFINRLKMGMRLQTDPTVIYGLGAKFDGNLRKADLQRDTPYNTYTRAGLPPTPIAMPGEEAIRAALNPADSKALYFVSRGDGTHVFSNSLDDHNRAVNKYQKSVVKK